MPAIKSLLVMETKYCTRCMCIRSLAAFPTPHNGRWCRECNVQAAREYARKNRSSVNAEKERWRRKNIDKVRQIQVRCNKKRKETQGNHVTMIQRVHRLVYKAVKSGKILKPNLCSLCHIPTRINAHHEDYSNPLDVVWLCHACHIARHKEINNKESVL